MEIRHLKLIKEVAEKKSLTKAKDALFLSQSALSHQLKEIENQLGTALFHRVNKQLILTNAGKMMLDSAEKVLLEIEKTQLSIKKYVSGNTGTLRLATQCYTCYHWLSSLLVDFKKEFPNIDLEILHSSKGDIEDKVLDGKIDIAIIYQSSDRPNIDYAELFRDEEFAIVPLDHPWANKPLLEAKDFENQNIIIHSYPLESITLFNQLLIPEKVKIKSTMQVQVTEAVIELVKAGMGIKVMAKWILEPYLKNNEFSLIPITKRGMHRIWHAITLKQDNQPQYIQNFIHHLKCNIGGLCCCPN